MKPISDERGFGGTLPFRRHTYIGGHLDYTGAVPEVDEDELTVLPLVPNPSEQLYLLSLLGFEDLGDRLRHPKVLRSCINRNGRNKA
jgi:hypothetical protein